MELSNNDTCLTYALINGDESAFNAVFHKYYKPLCVFASHYTGQAECEEVVQDVMLWLWENREMLPRELSIRPFLFSAVKNKCVNRITHKKMRYRVLEEILATYENLFDIPDGYERREILNLLEKALAELPAEFGEAFEMNRFGNMTYTEIAAKTGVSSKTVAYRISQTLKKLRVVFKDYLTSLLALA